VAMIGYVFSDKWAAQNRTVLDRFFVATRQAKEILAQSPDEWRSLAPQIKVAGMAGLEVYRRRYLDGIPRRPISAEVADSRTLYSVLADIGGTSLVGSARELDPGTFYKSGSAE
jgi:NitT/TauT family transport system substrate-binding protein